MSCTGEGIFAIRGLSSLDVVEVNDRTATITLRLNEAVGYGAHKGIKCFNISEGYH
jgi:hypothetical protein